MLYTPRVRYTSQTGDEPTRKQSIFGRLRLKIINHLNQIEAPGSPLVESPEQVAAERADLIDRHMRGAPLTDDEKIRVHNAVVMGVIPAAPDDRHDFSLNPMSNSLEQAVETMGGRTFSLQSNSRTGDPNSTTELSPTAIPTVRRN